MGMHTKRSRRRITRAEEERIWGLRCKQLTYDEIARIMDRSVQGVYMACLREQARRGAVDPREADGGE